MGRYVLLKHIWVKHWIPRHDASKVPFWRLILVCLSFIPKLMFFVLQMCFELPHEKICLMTCFNKYVDNQHHWYFKEHYILFLLLKFQDCLKHSETLKTGFLLRRLKLNLSLVSVTAYTICFKAKKIRTSCKVSEQTEFSQGFRLGIIQLILV